ncbi:MAG TPA: GxxExxY protein [Patescibacteria group bacterium]|jgi:GxxExxY protein|nr:GxxExxY protein [Patescibacteria group bacterium]
MSDATQFPDLGSELSKKIIGAGIKVHKALGPGLLENIYEECLAVELGRQNLCFERQKKLFLSYMMELGWTSIIKLILSWKIKSLSS